MSLFQSEYEVKISFEDLDPMYVVWHGNYMRYLEQARCDMLEKLGYTYIDMQNDNYLYPIVKMKVKYIKPATLGDVLTIKSEIISLEPTLDIKYTIFNQETGEKIFAAKTMQIGLNIKTKESLYTPPQGLLKAIKEVNNEKV